MSFDFQQLKELPKLLTDLPHLVKTIGYFGIWAIIFAESGLLIGFFLPGDSLLVAAGFGASQGWLNIWVLIFGCFICAVFGDNVGYATGHKLGRGLFQREDSRLFKKAYLVKAEDFYEKHGAKTLVLARFMPIVRTFVPIVAGISAMRYRTFMIYNLLGSFLWTFGVTLLGFFLGKTLKPEQVDKYLLPIILLIIVVSILPSMLHLFQKDKDKA